MERKVINRKHFSFWSLKNWTFSVLSIFRVRDKLLIFNMILQLWADVKFHVPTGFGFSPKARGFYPFGDATALAGEGGVRGVVWLIQAQLEIRHATALTTGAKHWHRQKAVFYVFCFGSPVFFH